eukprot:scaffold63175_cov35-Prasinocladus_malaysianus.AAC.1
MQLNCTFLALDAAKFFPVKRHIEHSVKDGWGATAEDWQHAIPHETHAEERDVRGACLGSGHGRVSPHLIPRCPAGITDVHWLHLAPPMTFPKAPKPEKLVFPETQLVNYYIKTHPE